EMLLPEWHRWRDHGSTVVVIEHSLDVSRTADWIIDLGPEGGAGGGEIIAEGTPEEIARKAGSYTAEHLKPVLDSETRRRNSALTAMSTGSASRGRKVSGDASR